MKRTEKNKQYYEQDRREERNHRSQYEQEQNYHAQMMIIIKGLKSSTIKKS